jgi:predicted porin
VQIYGTVDMGIGRLANQNPGPPTTGVTTVRGAHNGALQTSYIGFRGTEDLGDGLLAKFALESFFRVDTGTPGRFDASPAAGADQFWSRIAYVGLSGNFGEVRLGTNTKPLWLSMIQTNALGANSTFSPAFRQLYNGGTRGRSAIDSGMVNSLSYQTPVFGGFSGLAVLQTSEGRGTGSNYAASATYRGGPFMGTLAVQRARHSPVPNVGTAADQDMVLLGLAYRAGFLQAFAQYVEVDNVGNRSKLPHVGVAVPIGLGTVQFSTGEDKNRVVATGVTTKRKTTSLGYLHALSKRTDLYAFAMTEKFPVVGPAANSGDSYVVGISHRF